MTLHKNTHNDKKILDKLPVGIILLLMMLLGIIGYGILFLLISLL